MTKLLPTATLALALLAFSHSASADGGAGGAAGSFGIGAETQISGLGGVSASYDAGPFHAGAFFAFVDPTAPNNTRFDLGGRFFFHVHHTTSADFSLGGSLGFSSTDTPDAAGGATTANDVYLEPSFQIRWFVASNLALSFIGGFSIGLTNDDKTFEIDGLRGIAGIHYYFTK